MTTTEQRVTDLRTPQGASRFGYIIAIVVNFAMLVIANNILEWGWLPFLTADFGQILWLIDLSFIAAIAVNAIYLSYDPSWFKSMCQIGLGGISMAVAVQTYRVFPFDFSSYQVDWEPLTRFVIVLTMVGTGIAVIKEVVQLARGTSSTPKQGPQYGNATKGKR